MNPVIQNISSFFERQAFGVCAWWGNKLDVKISSIRLFFIYLTFITVGSPLVIYLIMAFMLRLRRYLHFGRRSVLDL